MTRTFTPDERKLWRTLIATTEWLRPEQIGRRAGVGYRTTALLLWRWAGEGLVEVARVRPRWHYRVSSNAARVARFSAEILGRKKSRAIRFVTK